MLRPDDRSHFAALMRPPIGYAVDKAVGTTFSLDLLAALLVPLGFAAHDWTNESGETNDPLAALEAIHRFSERLTVFCEAGQIKAPREYRRLITWLEEVVCEVQAPDAKGVFHPKVWALRFVKAGEPVRYRVLCLSRNLTFDRSWDTALALDGELADRDRGISRNHPLADFVEALPALARKPLSRERRIQVEEVADELRRVNFDLPDGFDELRFWHGGLKGSSPKKAWDRVDQVLIVSPFVSDDMVGKIGGKKAPVYLVSRPGTLQTLKQATLDRCKTVFALDPHAAQPGANEELPDAKRKDELLSGLHAKLFIVDRGWDASVFTGSFNATHHAFHHNVEFMVELMGKRSRYGVKEFLGAEKSGMKFVDLLTKFLPQADVGKDPNEEKAEVLFRVAKRTLLDAGPNLTASVGSRPDYFDLRLSFRGSCELDPQLRVICRPISLPEGSAQEIRGAQFNNVSLDRLSPLLAFELHASIDGSAYHCTFVTKADLEGAPADRQQRVFASLIADKTSLSRFLLLLLSNGDPTGENSADALEFLSGSSSTRAATELAPSLFETLLRTLSKQPSQLERIEKVLKDLRTSGAGSSLLDEEFQALWEPIWAARLGRPQKQ